MTREELINLGAKKVRNSPDLLSFYISLFTEVYGRAPKTCCGGFEPDFKRFATKVEPQKRIVMQDSKKTFQFKTKETGIIAFHDGKKKHYGYAHQVNDDFILKYLTNGSPDELAERAARFNKLPDGFESPTNEDKPKQKRRKK